MKKKIALIQLEARQKGVVSAIDGGDMARHRLMSMGIYVGREVTKLSQCVMRGPVAIRVGRSVLALGYGMASKITVETGT